VRRLPRYWPIWRCGSALAGTARRGGRDVSAGLPVRCGGQVRRLPRCPCWINSGHVFLSGLRGGGVVVRIHVRAKRLENEFAGVRSYPKRASSASLVLFSSPLGESFSTLLHPAFRFEWIVAYSSECAPLAGLGSDEGLNWKVRPIFSGQYTPGVSQRPLPSRDIRVEKLLKDYRLFRLWQRG
jgi:hypothetical protein